jgi:Tol biopolymer transport system component
VYGTDRVRATEGRRYGSLTVVVSGVDLRRGTLMRPTIDQGEDETPIWTPDGRWVLYTSTRGTSGARSSGRSPIGRPSGA